MINIIDTYILQWNINDEGINTIRLCFFLQLYKMKYG